METRWYGGSFPTFSDMFQLRGELDRLFDIGLPLANIRSVPRGTFPAINMREDKDAVRVDACLPGVDPAKVAVTIEDNVLSIEGTRDPVDPGQSGTFHRRERFSGSFRRVLSLPDGVDSEKVEAHYRDGVLHISVGKREDRKPKQISVNVD